MVKEKVSAGSKMSEAIMDFLINIPMFDALKGDELQIAATQMNFIDLEKSEILFKEGEKGDYVCFVVEGSLDVLKKSDKGKYVVLARLPRGRSIGEMAVIDDFPRSATVRARERTTLVILTRKNFELIMEKHPQVGNKILKGIARLLSQNLRMTSSRLVDHLLPIS